MPLLGAQSAKAYLAYRLVFLSLMKVGKDFCFGGEGKSNYHFHNQPNEKPTNLVNSRLFV